MGAPGSWQQPRGVIRSSENGGGLKQRSEWPEGGTLRSWQRRGDTLPQGLQKEPALPALGFWDRGPQDREVVNSWCSKPLNLG